MTDAPTQARRPPTWTRRFDREWDGDLFMASFNQDVEVRDAAGHPIGKMQAFLIGKSTGTVEIAIVDGEPGLRQSDSCFPIPWELFKYEQDFDGYVCHRTSDFISDGPSFGCNARMEWSYADLVSFFIYYRVAF